MAIDRDTAYYKEWRNDRNWKLRFEVIPAGKFIDSSHNYQPLSWVAMKRGAVSIKSQKTSFGDVPSGIMDAPSLTVEFELSDLQANLLEMLKAPFYNHSGEALDVTTTNLFILKSDRGTGTISYIEFMGGQKYTLSNSFGMTAKDGAFAAQRVTIDAIDVFKLTLEQVTTATWANNIITRGKAGESHYVPAQVSQFITDYLVQDASSRYIQAYNRQLPEVAVYAYQPAYMFTYGLQSAIQAYLAAWTRSGNPTTYNTELTGTPIQAFTFYESATSASNARGSTLADSAIYCVGKTTHLSDQDDLYGGMLVADKNSESYLQYTYLWDLMKNVCAWGCVKFSYRPKLVANGTGGTMDLSYEMSYDNIFHNFSNTTIDLSDRFADAHPKDTFEFTPCSGVYTSVTTEITNEGGTDLDHFEARILGTMSDERINVQMVHHNNPTGDGLVLDAAGIAMEERIHPRKLYYLKTSNTLYKIHESVKINDQITNTDYNNPLAITYSGDIDKSQAYATASQQQNGLHIAIANFYLSRFSNKNQSEIKCTMYMIDGETMPENVGCRVTVPTFSGFDGTDKAMIMEATADWNRGTIDLAFITRGE